MLSRRGLLAAPIVLAAGCGSDFGDTRLRFAAGPREALWWKLGTLLAGQWRRRLDIPAPRVLASRGPYPNMDLLLRGSADLAMETADIAVHAANRHRPGGPLALGQMYGDVLQVLVHEQSAYRRLTDLRSKRIWTAVDGVRPLPVVQKLLEAAGMTAGRDYTASHLPVPEAFDALARRRIDALCFSGGTPLPGAQTTEPARRVRLLDLTDLVAAVRDGSPSCTEITVPSNLYGPHQAKVTSIRVPNYLLATNRLADDLARALLQALFAAKEDLAMRLPQAQSIDERQAIDTATVPLHPGALAYYRSAKP